MSWIPRPRTAPGVIVHRSALESLVIFSPDAPHPAYSALTPLFAAAEPSFRALLASAERHAADLARIRDGGPGLVGARPARFAQDWFPRLDAVAAYTMVRQARPARILEIGCGHSSRFMAQAIVDGDLGTDFICVDPRPRAPLVGLPLRHAARLFGPQDAEIASRFAAGDVLFVDSSHVVEPGGEIETLLLDVLPRLPAGALVHFHDVFLPDGYPAAWAGRRYNEQTAVGALLGGGGYEIVFASRYVATRTELLAGTIVETLPLGPGAPEVSLWLRKTASTVGAGRLDLRSAPLR